MPARCFTDLEVWKVADELETRIFTLAQSLPAAERFRLADQMIRAARSIPANIAEGFRLHWPREKAHAYGIAQGSCGELKNHVLVCGKHNFCKDIQPYLALIDRVERMLRRLVEATLNTRPARP